MPRRSAAEMAALRARWIEQVCTLRDEGWTYERIAERVGVSPATLSGWVASHAGPVLASANADWLRRRYYERQRYWADLLTRFPPDAEGEEAIADLAEFMAPVLRGRRQPLRVGERVAA